MGELDGAGYPLSYCMLSTQTAIDVGKRTKALTAWVTRLRDQYGIDPRFCHTDKDMAQISMARVVWPLIKVQLCWWHLRKFVRQRLARNELATTPYNAHRAHREFSWITVDFVPAGQPNHDEYEGGHHDTEAEITQGQVSINTILLRIPPTQTAVAQDISPTPSDEPPLTIRIPPPNNSTAPANTPRRIFCPEECREPIINMLERHFCAHPTIPGFSHPSPAGIREWAVKQMYTFCVNNDLQEVWAYLWENWYRSGRWELWARAPCPEIPRLKTTMMLESQ